MDLWLPGCPVNALPYLGQQFTPSALVMHRTIGHWGGDYSVLSKGRVPSVHFLFGENGEAVQFYPITRTCAHAAGANGYAIGVETSGANGDLLTSGQMEWFTHLLGWLRGQGINPDVRLGQSSGRVAWFAGLLNHVNVATSPQYTHYDYIRDENVATAAGGGAVRKDREMKVVKKQGTDALYSTDGIFKSYITPAWYAILAYGDAAIAKELGFTNLGVLTIPAAEFDNLMTTPFSGGGGGPAPAIDYAALAKAVNDDVARRLAS